jgi:hypothetical protein
MPRVHCPECQSPQTQWLPDPSRYAVVDYYRCEECHHVWNVRKDQPDAVPKAVTLPAEKQPA